MDAAEDGKRTNKKGTFLSPSGGLIFFAELRETSSIISNYARRNYIN